MLYQKLKWTVIISLALLVMQSCTKDEDSPVELQELSEFAKLTTDDDTAQRLAQPTGGNGNGSGETNSRVIQEWVNLFLELERYALGMRPNASARAIAYINLAAYETVVPSMDNFTSNSNQIPGLNIQRNTGPGGPQGPNGPPGPGGPGGPGGPNGPDNINIDYQIALNACYADVLAHFLLNVPSDSDGQIEDLEERIENQLRPRGGQQGGNQLVNNSRAWGATVASQIIAFSQTDAAAEAQILDPQPHSYVPPTGAGYWTFSAEPERALFPYWSQVRTFIISSDETSTVAPPILYSEIPGSPYYQQMMEVYHANNSAKANQGEQLWIAEFWSDDVETVMFSPPARQLSIANQLIRQQRINLEEALYLNLKLGFALNDAAVSTWNDKYEYMVMRPSVYIQEFIDPSYQTNLFSLIPWPNPTFPGYPSGHSCFASAAAGVFIDFLGNNINFTDRSHQGRDEFLGAPRSFNSFTEMAEENGYSRLPLGVHISMDCTEGLRLGYEISDAVNDYNLTNALP